MADVRAVGVKDLKNNLSAYLREVRRGVRILVTDRQRVVAELHEPGGGAAATEPLLRLAAQGVVRLPSAARRPLPTSPIRRPDGTSAALLDELRRDGGPGGE
jgi:antitoxin (DNA-binding transcriptional repressor) of toxin-antitoxin stability system